MAAFSLTLTSLLSYLIGALPFGYLVARWRGVDILKQGSGNIGATNVGRVLGRPFGVLVFLLDFTKGAGPALAAKWFASTQSLELPPDSLPVAAAVAAFLGHLYPIYLRFHGGKGVATAAGAVSVLLPEATLAALLVWLVVVLASRYVSLASLAAAAVLCVFRLFLTPQPWSVDHRIPTAFCLIAAGFIFLRHRTNVSRLLHGNENRLKETPTMLHFSKILHVLSLGLWFGTTYFFSFVVGLNLFGTFERVAAEPPAERPIWFPMWKAHDDPAPGPTLPAPLRKEQGTRAAGVAIAPLFHWYFRIQAVCALLATATAFAWWRMGAGRLHRLRAGILLMALLTVVLGWRVEYTVEDLRGLRNSTFDAMVRHSPPRTEDVSEAVSWRGTFAAWHLSSVGLNMATVLLVTIAMAQAAYLPISAAEDKKIV
jgi:acyl phosphate:glycerol-3-phosphate acyltransferase